jgi:hypothetical protein
MNSVVGIASVVASNAVAGPVDVLQDDPVFAAIARYEEAVRAEMQAAKERSDTEENFEQEFGALHPDAFSREMREGLATIEPKFRECMTSTHEKIDACRGRFPDEVIAAFHDELDRQKTAYAERVKPKERAWANAYDAVGEAGLALIQIAPTTRAGIIALLGYIRDNGQLATIIMQWEIYSDDDDVVDPTGSFFGVFIKSLSESVEQMIAA